MNQLVNSDLAEIHGGFAPIIVWVAAASAGALYQAHFSNIIVNWSDFKTGVAEGYNSVAH